MALEKLIPPTFWQRAAALWIDFVLLVGLYFLLGFISENLYKVDAYPPATGMQFYNDRDFEVFWFFVKSIFLLTTLYLFSCYKFFGTTLGQKLTNIRLLKYDGEMLDNKAILLRIVTVLIRLFVIFIPGPIVALIFFMLGTKYLNETLSMLLLFSFILFFLYLSITSYNNGKTRTLSDKFSKTILIKTSELRPLN